MIYTGKKSLINKKISWLNQESKVEETKNESWRELNINVEKMTVWFINKKSLINQQKSWGNELWLIKKFSWLSKKIMLRKQKIKVGGNERIICYVTYTLP